MLRRSVFRIFGQRNLLSLSSRTVYRSALDNPDKIAVIDSNGQYSYSNLLSASMQLRDKLPTVTDDKQKTTNRRIAFLCNPDASFVVAQWACWLSRAICIPLCKDHPQALLEYYIEDAKCSCLIVSPEYEKLLRPVVDKFKIPLIIITNKDIELGKTKKDILSSNQQQLDIFSKNSDDALILYTSGTTGKPKVNLIFSSSKIYILKYLGCCSYSCYITCTNGCNAFSLAFNKK
jgi:acyl-CoA synthetase (AMP-forming)/AMP-acid ligase II